MIQITKEQFEDILFDPNISIAEKKSTKRCPLGGGRTVVIKLLSKGRVLAKREVSPRGNLYYGS